jgi:hypothetical protein
VDKIDLLIVRACKSREPLKRLHSVYRRFYLIQGKPDKHLVVILSRLCDKYVPFKIIDVLNELSPATDWKYEECEDFYSRAVMIMIIKIRLADIDCFPGYVSPACFRNAA